VTKTTAMSTGERSSEWSE